MFLDGMEGQDRSGFKDIARYLGQLPVPAGNKTRSMSHADARKAISYLYGLIRSEKWLRPFCERISQYIPWPWCTLSWKYIPVCTCMYLVSTQLHRTWIILHLKHQDVFYCKWEVYTCMIRPESKALTIEKPSFLWYSIYRYIPCLFGI
jgi:hypothetical protein